MEEESSIREPLADATATVTYHFASPQDRLFPPMIIVDITNVCNLSYIHCAHHVIQKQPHYIPHYMDLDVFRKIVEEVSQHDILLMRIASDGESLLHPEFFEMLEMADRAGITPINLTTNGMLLTDETNRRLIESNLSVLDVSIDAATEETYRKIRRKGEIGRAHV